jgi:hypothetical protein
MRVPEPDRPQYSPWEYPFRKWPREESFWREMTTRTLSALIAASLIALAAVLSGVGTHDQRIQVLKTLGFSVLGVVVVYGVVKLTLRTVKLLPRKTRIYVRQGTFITVIYGRLGKKKQTKLRVDAQSAGFWQQHKERIMGVVNEGVDLDIRQTDFQTAPPGFKDFALIGKSYADSGPTVAWKVLD